MRLTRLLSLALVLVLAFGFSGMAPRNAHAQGLTTSVVSVYATSTCCQYLSGLFTINVLLTLAPGVSISGFDVILNYTNPHTNSNPGTIHAESLNYQQNIFDPYPNTQVLFDCVDGTPQGSSTTCTDAPNVGQIELTESLLGAATSSGGRLFSVAFQVTTGSGTSIFTIVRANVINPHGDPSNPQAIDPVFIPVITQDGIFGNVNGAIPFFTYQPADTSQSPAVLPNQQVNFNATSSFAGYNTTIGFKQYDWNFGDGSANATGATPNHTFRLPGNYTVSLTAVDNNNEKGTISRTVDVHFALGSILLTVRNQIGSAIQENIIVKAYNASASTTPFATFTVLPNGNVQLNRLTPSDTYYLSFIGQGFQNQTKTYSVKPGFTTMDTVYLTATPNPPDYSGLIYLISFAAAIAVITVAIVYTQRKNRTTGRSSKSPTGRTSKKS